MGIDWAPTSNRIVTCLDNGTSSVWSLTDDNTWNPQLVLLRINRTTTYVKWSPNENKFAVASGANTVVIVVYDGSFWISKHIKKHKSTVLQVAWHPNNILLATASCDCKVRIFSVYLTYIDGRSMIENNPFKQQLPFGELLAEFDHSLSWVKTIRWSPSGKRVAFAGQDSTVHVVDVSVTHFQVYTTKHFGLPFRDLLFFNDSEMIFVGDDFSPMIFKLTNDGKLRCVHNLDSCLDQAAPTIEICTSESIERTKHKNAIICIQPRPTTNEHLLDISTSGLDGKLIIWNIPMTKNSVFPETDQ